MSRDPTTDLCLRCSEVSNLTLCGPPMSGFETETAYKEARRNTVWVGPTVEHIRQSAATCCLCRVILAHVSGKAMLLSDGTDLAAEDPTRRICLVMINDGGYQSDGTQSWQSYGMKSSAGIAAISVGIERTPGSCEWVQKADFRTCLRVYAPKQCSATMNNIIMRKEVDKEILPSTLEVPRKWLEDCVVNHWRCKETLTGSKLDDTRDEAVELPNRIITILNNKWSVRKAVQRRGRYAALSYCWGDAASVSSYKLQLHNIVDLEQDHDLDDTVPKTYREAMLLTRALGLQYLWIDALCIVQDDITEWEREARKMSSIYQNATITFAALASEGISDGLLRRVTPTTVAELPWLVRDCDGTSRKTDHIFVTADLPVEIPYAEHALSGLSQEIRVSKWATRGWIFQEAVLSRRILYMGQHNLYWECSTKIRSEDGWDDKVVERIPRQGIQFALAFCNNALESVINDIRPVLYGQEERSEALRHRILRTVLAPFVEVAGSTIVLGIAKYLQDYHARYFHSLDTSGLSFIYGFVESYTSKSLSNSSDRLVAFEGFAKTIAQRTDQEFHSGVFTNGVAYSLYWCMVPNKSSLQVSTDAPTWSWASRTGQISFPVLSREGPLGLLVAANEDRKLIYGGGYNGDLMRVRFLDENARMRPARGVRFESIDVEGHLASGFRSPKKSNTYPETLKQLAGIFRLTLRSGHHRHWLDTDSHLLFIDRTSDLHADVKSPANHLCPRCKQQLDMANEYGAIIHLENCADVRQSASDGSPRYLKLYGLTLFDDPEQAPSTFKVLVLSHGKDMGTIWHSRTPDCSVPNDPPAPLQDRVLLNSTESVFGVQWARRTDSVGEAYRALAKPLHIYYLLLVQETETVGHYVRVGIGVGFWLPGPDIFEGLESTKTGSKSSMILI